MWTRCLGGFSVKWVTILLISPVKKRIFAQNDQIWPKIGIFGWYGPGHAGLFSALLVGRLVVVTRGLYLARHLFTIYIGLVSSKTGGCKGNFNCIDFFCDFPTDLGFAFNSSWNGIGLGIECKLCSKYRNHDWVISISTPFSAQSWPVSWELSTPDLSFSLENVNGWIFERGASGSKMETHRTMTASVRQTWNLSGPAVL